MFYYHEWMFAEKDGRTEYALKCKEMYRELTLKSLERPHRYYNEKLKDFPPINLN